MRRPRSVIIEGGTAADVPSGTPLLFAYGDHDDHLRLAVLIAEHFRARSPHVEEEARACMDSTSSWSDRLEALRGLLKKAAEPWREGCLLGIGDLDALYPTGGDVWDDRESVRERRELFDELLVAIDGGGWLVLRTSPSDAVSRQLIGSCAEHRLGSEEQSPIPEDGLDLVTAECRPVATWLVREGHLRPRDIERIAAVDEELDAHLLMLACGALPPSARDTAKLLSVVRPPQAANGMMGDFRWGEGAPSAEAVPRRAVERLQECGFLQPGGESSPDRKLLRMPRVVRSWLQGLAQMSLRGEVERTRRRLADQPIEDQPATPVVEAHFHAVQLGDIELAMRTSRFYRSDLRVLATRLSQHERRWSDAARLFQFIVDADPRDAYAQEYLAYNLARSGATADRERILGAYQAAHDLDPGNPLYHGRLLGYLAERREGDISAEFDRGMDLYKKSVERGRRKDAVTYFAEPVLNGLKRGQQHALEKTLLERWGPTLARYAPHLLPKA